MHGSSLYIIL